MRKLIVYEVLSGNDCPFFVIHFFHREKYVYNFTPQPEVTLAIGSAKDILDSVSEHHLAITMLIGLRNGECIIAVHGAIFSTTIFKSEKKLLDIRIGINSEGRIVSSRGFIR